MHRRVAFITGITGQDGLALTAHLLEHGYRVHGLKRRSASANGERLARFAAAEREGRLVLHHGDVTDLASLLRALDAARPAEVYNLAAQSHVQVSFEKPLYTASVNALGALNLLEAVRLTGRADEIRVYQASTSEMYGIAGESPQDEDTPFRPRSPYAIAKLFAHHATVNAREAYGLHASSGICFNHEGPDRGEHFVSRKITRAVAARTRGERGPLRLGNLDAVRDWGHVADYVAGMRLMLAQERGDDYVLATGKAHSVRDFVRLAFAEIDIRVVWEGEGLAEQGRDARTGALLVVVDPQFFRPAEVHALLGNPAKAAARLGWRTTTSFEALVAEMVAADMSARGGEG